MIPYPGPLFYPPVGMIAVTASGARIEVWDNESDSGDCFTGLMLQERRTYAQTVVCDLSCCWGRENIHHIEEPTETDLAISFWPGRVAA